MSDGHIGTLTPGTLAARLDDLRDIKDGWLDGCGLAPSPEGLDWLTQGLDRLSHCFESHYHYALPPPYLYPTAEGGVQAEWSFGPYEITLEINLSLKSGEWHLLHTETGQYCWEDLDLAQSERWSFIAKQIGNYQIFGALCS